jgi:hypothetical protein
MYGKRLFFEDLEVRDVVLMLHQGNTFYKRRFNRFTTIVLQEQGLDRKLQDLCLQD